MTARLSTFRACASVCSNDKILQPPYTPQNSSRSSCLIYSLQVLLIAVLATTGLATNTLLSQTTKHCKSTVRFYSLSTDSAVHGQHHCRLTAKFPGFYTPFLIDSRHVAVRTSIETDWTYPCKQSQS